MGKENRKAKPTYYDEERDKDLLEWLNSKGNYSSYVRIKLYEIMNSEKNGMVAYHQPPQEKEKEKEKKNFGSGFANAMVKSAKK